MFELEKRIRELGSKYQLMVKEAEDMKKEMETSKQQSQQLFRILAAKKILDSGKY